VRSSRAEAHIPSANLKIVVGRARGLGSCLGAAKAATLSDNLRPQIRLEPVRTIGLLVWSSLPMAAKSGGVDGPTGRRGALAEQPWRQRAPRRAIAMEGQLVSAFLFANARGIVASVGLTGATFYVYGLS